MLTPCAAEIPVWVQLSYAGVAKGLLSGKLLRAGAEGASGAVAVNAVGLVLPQKNFYASSASMIWEN